MRLEILSSVELEALSLEGKDLIGRSHSIVNREKRNSLRIKQQRW
jgi:hypothetical protein